MIFYKELFTPLKAYLIEQKIGVLAVLKSADPYKQMKNKINKVLIRLNVSFPWLVNKCGKACKDNLEAFYYLMFNLEAP